MWHANYKSRVADRKASILIDESANDLIDDRGSALKQNWGRVERRRSYILVFLVVTLTASRKTAELRRKTPMNIIEKWWTEARTASIVNKILIWGRYKTHS